MNIAQGHSFFSLQWKMVATHESTIVPRCAKTDNVPEINQFNEKDPLEVVVWICNTFDINLGIKNGLTQYLMEIRW